MKDKMKVKEKGRLSKGEINNNMTNSMKGENKLKRASNYKAW